MNLQLNKGLLSQALLAKAGPKLQEELDRVGQAKAVGMGTVLQTSGHGLHCHHVLHVVAPDWRDGCTSSHKVGPSFRFSGKLGHLWDSPLRRV